MIRWIVEDDERQAAETRRILGQAVDRGERVLVTDVVLSQVEWVLESAYGVPRQRILAAVQTLAADRRFQFEDAPRLAVALHAALRRLDGFTVLA